MVLVSVALVVPLAGANGPMGGTEIVTLNMPADGTGTVTRTPMPPSSTVGTVGVTATSSDDTFMNNLVQVLTSLPTRKSRVLGCIGLNAYLADAAGHSEDFEVDARTLQLIFLSACLRVALDLKQQAGTPGTLARAPAAACSQSPVSLPIHITKTAKGYKAIVKGTTSIPKKMAFRVSCKRTKTSLKTTIRSTKRGGKLSKAIGPILSAGFASSSASSATLKIALGVR
jgi:hypothetical protein